MLKFVIRISSIVALTLISGLSFASTHKGGRHFYKANDPYFQYTGRVDFSNPLKPKFWMPAVYIKAHFTGNNCSIFLEDELPGNIPHNYVAIVIDDQTPLLFHVTNRLDTINVSNTLNAGDHTIVICKATESGLGYLGFLGMECDRLLPPPPLPARKMEFIGNSITCGFGNDASTPCSTGQWYDHEDAYEGYGPVTARALHAQWHISAVSGIGMIHSCCNMSVLMPEVFDKMNMRNDSVSWNFKNYIPDVVTICLGQNDGIQDSVDFCGAYVSFIQTLRGYYPDAKIVCLNSPMADKKLNPVLENYITGVVNYFHHAGDEKVYKFFFDKRFIHGCYGHPSGEEDQQLSSELTPYIRKITGW